MKLKTDNWFTVITTSEEDLVVTTDEKAKTTTEKEDISAKLKTTNFVFNFSSRKISNNGDIYKSSVFEPLLSETGQPKMNGEKNKIKLHTDTVV